MNQLDGTRRVFITGGTGYMGSRLIPALLARGFAVRALVRPGSERRLPPGATPVVGDALDAATYAHAIHGEGGRCTTFVQLVGVAHPRPRKVAQFLTVDLASARAGMAAARQAGVPHFVYVSVAHPAPAMKAYVAARMEAEKSLRASKLNATVLRPWYVLGPGHRWPYVLLPVYWLFELIPWTRATARRLGLVTIRQMITALVQVVENPVQGIAMVDVPGIRAAR
jgi:uncharacterized protein YbjT (DUF2867 family)